MGGYAGGGGGGAFEPSSGGSGGGGSSYADKERLSDVKMLGSERYQPPAKDDPFWQGVDNPVDDGTATGGSNSLGGYGLVVLQWKGPDKQAPAELTHASGDGQTVKVGRDFDPLAVVVRDKNGAPVTDQKVVFTLVDPDRSKLHFSPSDVEDGDELPTVTVKSDAQGVATSSPVLTGTGVGDFTVRADAGDASTTFSLRVTPRSRVLKIVSGDGQKADPGEEFAKPLKVELTEEDSQFANTGVTFEVQGDTEGAPTFKGGESSAETWTNPNAVATAPDLTAGKTPGTYKIVATSEETTATFEVTVVGSASASPTPSASTSASPSAGASTSGGSGPGSAQGGSGGGHLALTGAAGIGTLAAAAATLAALG
ncbi:Ig-like domain-containing protein, partial [Streptomyces kunmingensis]